MDTSGQVTDVFDVEDNWGGRGGGVHTALVPPKQEWGGRGGGRQRATKRGGGQDAGDVRDVYSHIID